MSMYIEDETTQGYLRDQMKSRSTKSYEEIKNYCEWKKINSNRYDCLAHAESYDSRVLDWLCCPYCKKEIKVVER